MSSCFSLLISSTTGDILCAFYAFQANKKKGTGVAMYSDPEESARRLEYFAETVRSVTETNASFDKGEITWTAGCVLS